MGRTQSLADFGRTIGSADIVYVGGGNTLRMMKLWRRRGVDRLLARAAGDGTVMAGVSAGAICWCTAGVSDSRSFTWADGAWPHIAVRGLGLVDVLLCPHYGADLGRQDAMQRLAPRRRLVGIGLEDCTALQVIDGSYRILSCRAADLSLDAPADVKKFFTSFDADIASWQAAAPADIKPAIAESMHSIAQLETILKKDDYDYAKAASDPAFGAVDNPNTTTAGGQSSEDQINAYMQKECGITDNTSSAST